MQDEEHRERVQQFLDFAPPETIAHPQLRVLEKYGLSIRRGLSFHTIMIQRSEGRRIGVRDVAWTLDSKTVGYRFADQLGLRRPVADLTHRRLTEITPQPMQVVKPLRSTGARGVYLVFAADRILDMRAGDKLSSRDQAVERAQQLMADQRRRLPDRWITEELILDRGKPARDLKFFCFYGEVLFVQEIERHPTFRACFWSPDGSAIETGKRTGLTNGYGVTKEQVAFAESISSQIPAPFLRIDMLRSGKRDLVVGEFTPRPGQFEQFDERTDRLMGETWLRAERRLLDDALAGKQFPAFNAATEGR
jgi:hypothetical protein